jgi:hypothetical protein
MTMAAEATKFIAWRNRGTTIGDVIEVFGDLTSSHSAKLPITKKPHKLLYGVFYGPDTAACCREGAD